MISAVTVAGIIFAGKGDKEAKADQLRLCLNQVLDLMIIETATINTIEHTPKPVSAVICFLKLISSAPKRAVIAISRESMETRAAVKLEILAAVNIG